MGGSNHSEEKKPAIQGEQSALRLQAVKSRYDSTGEVLPLHSIDHIDGVQTYVNSLAFRFVVTKQEGFLQTTEELTFKQIIDKHVKWNNHINEAVLSHAITEEQGFALRAETYFAFTENNEVEVSLKLDLDKYFANEPRYLALKERLAKGQKADGDEHDLILVGILGKRKPGHKDKVDFIEATRIFVSVKLGLNTACEATLKFSKTQLAEDHPDSAQKTPYMFFYTYYLFVEPVAQIIEKLALKAPDNSAAGLITNGASEKDKDKAPTTDEADKTNDGKAGAVTPANNSKIIASAAAVAFYEEKGTYYTHCDEYRNGVISIGSTHHYDFQFIERQVRSDHSLLTGCQRFHTATEQQQRRQATRDQVRRGRAPAPKGGSSTNSNEARSDAVVPVQSSGQLIVENANITRFRSYGLLTLLRFYAMARERDKKSTEFTDAYLRYVNACNNVQGTIKLLQLYQQAGSSFWDKPPKPSMKGGAGSFMGGSSGNGVALGSHVGKPGKYQVQTHLWRLSYICVITIGPKPANKQAIMQSFSDNRLAELHVQNVNYAALQPTFGQMALLEKSPDELRYTIPKPQAPSYNYGYEYGYYGRPHNPAPRPVELTAAESKSVDEQLAKARLIKPNCVQWARMAARLDNDPNDYRRNRDLKNYSENPANWLKLLKAVPRYLLINLTKDLEKELSFHEKLDLKIYELERLNYEIKARLLWLREIAEKTYLELRGHDVSLEDVMEYLITEITKKEFNKAYLDAFSDKVDEIWDYLGAIRHGKNYGEKYPYVSFEHYFESQRRENRFWSWKLSDNFRTAFENAGFTVSWMPERSNPLFDRCVKDGFAFEGVEHLVFTALSDAIERYKHQIFYTAPFMDLFAALRREDFLHHQKRANANWRAPKPRPTVPIGNVIKVEAVNDDADANLDPEKLSLEDRLKWYQKRAQKHNYAAILGVKDEEFTKNVIERLFRQLVLQYHPDKSGSLYPNQSEEDKKIRAEVYQIIYDIRPKALERAAKLAYAQKAPVEKKEEKAAAPRPASAAPNQSQGPSQVPVPASAAAPKPSQVPAVLAPTPIPAAAAAPRPAVAPAVAPTPSPSRPASAQQPTVAREAAIYEHLQLFKLQQPFNKADLDRRHARLLDEFGHSDALKTIIQEAYLALTKLLGSAASNNGNQDLGRLEAKETPARPSSTAPMSSIPGGIDPYGDISPLSPRSALSPALPPAAAASRNSAAIPIHAEAAKQPRKLDAATQNMVDQLGCYIDRLNKKRPQELDAQQGNLMFPLASYRAHLVFAQKLQEAIQKGQIATEAMLLDSVGIQKLWHEDLLLLVAVRKSLTDCRPGVQLDLGRAAPILRI